MVNKRYTELMSAGKLFNSAFFLMLALICFYLISPFDFWQFHPVLQDAEKITLGVLFSLILLAAIIVKLIIRKGAANLTIRDFILVLYLVFLILHACIINAVSLDPLLIAENVLLISLFVCFRNLQPKQIVLLFWLLTLACLCQIGYGILVQTKLFAPGYGLSDIKGSFINQGPFAGFISCIIIITLGLGFYYLKNSKGFNGVKKWFVGLLLFASTAILLLTLIYTQSRAAWVAAILSLLFYGWRILKIGDHLKVIHFPLIKYIFFISMVLLIIGSSYSLYNFKKDSADGRILIWKTTLEMVSDRPMLGHGVNTFQANYMNYQANYFESHPSNQYQYLAADNRYAFNEFLRIASEQGMLGVFFLGVLIVLFIRENKKIRPPNDEKYLQDISWTGLLVIIVFGFFSYPGEILQLKLIGCLFLAILSSSSKSILGGSELISKTTSFTLIKKFFLMMLLVGLPFIFLQFMKLSNACNDWNSAFFETNSIKNDKSIPFCENVYPILKNNGDFLAMYGKALTKAERFNEAIDIIQQAELLMPSTITYIDKGKNYEGLGWYSKAEKSWMRASYMVPSQFRPEYLIAKMYYSNGQTEKAQTIANHLLEKQVKVHSIPVHQMLDELKEMVLEIK